MLTVFVGDRSGHLMSGAAESSDYSGEGPVEAEYVEFVVEWIEGLSW